MAEVKLTVLGEDRSQPAQTAITKTNDSITALEAVVKEFGSYVTALGGTVNKGLQGIESGFSSMRAKGENSIKSLVDASEEQISRLNALGKGVADRLSPHFEALGIRSSQAIEAQRDRAAASYEAIKKSGVASADEISRAEKALQAKTAELDAELKGTIATTKKMDSQVKATATSTRQWADVVGVVKTALVALGITISAMAMVNLAKDTAMMAARYETLGVTMVVVGNNAGYSGAKMDGFQRSLESAGIAMIESRQNLTMMAQAHIDLTKSAELARIAQDAAVIGGINSSEAFTRMIYGIQSAQVEVLRTIGINVNFENSYKKLGLQLGKSGEDLTELEKSQARTNAVMEKGKDIAGSYEAAMGTAGKQITSMQRYVDNLKVTMGSVFNDALIVAVEGFTGALKAGNKEATEMAQKGQLKQWGQDLVLIMATLADGIGIVYNVLNTLVLTGVAGLQELYYGATAFMQALNGDFSGAKDSFNTMLATGEAWTALVAKQWEGTTKYQDAARKMFADRDNQANKSALLDKQNAAEAQRMAAGAETRAAEAAKATSLAKEKSLERELEAVKTAKAAENALLKEQTGISMEILKNQFDRGLVATGSYYDQVQQASLAAAQERFKTAAEYLQKETELLAAVGKNMGESSPAFAKELLRNKQAVEAMQLAQLAYASTFVNTEAAKRAALKSELESYEKLTIATLEAAGQFEAAEAARQALARNSADYLRLEANAATGNAAAVRALADQHRLDAIATVEGHNKTADAARSYAESVAVARDAVAALDGKEASLIKNEADLRSGLDKEKRLLGELRVAWEQGNVAAISSLSAQMQAQDAMNRRMQTEIDLLNRKKELLGQIVGYSNGQPIYADSYARSQAATGYVSNAQLLSGGAPSIASIQNSPFTNLNSSTFNDWLPGFDVGTPYVPHDMVARIHKGERIVTAADNAKGNYGGVTITGGIQITVVEAASPGETVDAISRQLDPKLNELARRRRAA